MEALNQLIPLIYEQLRTLARARLRNERPGHMLNTSDLVHEAYLKLIDINRMQWENRSHFFAMASQVMHRILVDHARKQKTDKRGGGWQKVKLDEERLLPEAYAETLLELDDALKRLEARHPRQGQAVGYRYFGSLTNQETAEALGISGMVRRDGRLHNKHLASCRQYHGSREMPEKVRTGIQKICRVRLPCAVESTIPHYHPP